MTTQQKQSATVLVIDHNAEPAAALKNMIEFLDTPAVTIAGVNDWSQIASQLDVSAVFLGPSLSSAETNDISTTLRQLLPAVPVVIVGNEDAAND